MNILKILSPLVITLIWSCGSSPKVIVEDTPGESAFSVESEPADMNNTSPSTGGQMHQVVALDILQAERYTYLQVAEKLDTFWIAANKFEAQKGHEYYYQGGLLKTEFISQEHNRIFDKIYLVSNIIDAAAHPGGNAGSPAMPTDDNHVPTDAPREIAGATKLSDLIKNKQNYEGKKVIVSGKCVKANYEIMCKNWYHIQDGSKKGIEPYDITITSMENIPLGANVAFEGTVVLNKDFGAGYSYEIIMEEATLK